MKIICPNCSRIIDIVEKTDVAVDVMACPVCSFRAKMSVLQQQMFSKLKSAENAHPDKNVANNQSDVAPGSASCGDDVSRTSPTHDNPHHGGSYNPDYIDVRVLEVVQTDQNQDGVLENVAVIRMNGHEVMVVDNDLDGVADVAIADFNHDGNNDIVDLTGFDIAMPVAADADVCLAHNEGADEANNADVGFYKS